MSRTIEDDLAAIADIDVIPRILEVVTRTTGLRFAAVARVTDTRWVACAVRDEIAFGLVPGGELELTTTICHEIRQSGQAVVIDHVAEDPAFRDHHTPKMYGLQSYISTPIYHRGEFFGTLCAIDPDPSKVALADALKTLQLFAELIGSHLDAQTQLAQSQAALLDERQAAELREQFIAVLSHDLRNPLAALDGGARLLAKTPLNERAVYLLDQMRGSVGRMTGLIDNVMDFARGRLGGGLGVELREGVDVAAVLAQVVAELRTAQPDREIDVLFTVSEPITADSRRLAQMFSNLISNALTYGLRDAPVQVTCRMDAGTFEFSVANAGPAIAPDVLPNLFKPSSAPPMARTNRASGWASISRLKSRGRTAGRSMSRPTRRRGGSHL